MQILFFLFSLPIKKYAANFFVFILLKFIMMYFLHLYYIFSPFYDSHNSLQPHYPSINIKTMLFSHSPFYFSYPKQPFSTQTKPLTPRYNSKQDNNENDNRNRIKSIVSSKFILNWIPFQRHHQIPK